MHVWFLRICFYDLEKHIHRSKKRRIEDVDDEHHGEFDANELRQHEEFTKVKNVDSVELGQYQMETWYFSPLPAEYNNCKVGLLLTLPYLPRRDCATCAGMSWQ